MSEPLTPDSLIDFPPRDELLEISEIGGAEIHTYKNKPSSRLAPPGPIVSAVQLASISSYLSLLTKASPGLSLNLANCFLLAQYMEFCKSAQAHLQDQH
jgi:hypothetical protein